MSHFQFYKLRVEAPLKSLKKELGLSKTDYRRASFVSEKRTKNSLRECTDFEEIQLTERLWCLQGLEVDMLLGKLISLVIVSDLRSIKAVSSCKCTVERVGPLFQPGKAVSVAVPIDSGLFPVFIMRVTESQLNRTLGILDGETFRSNERISISVYSNDNMGGWKHFSVPVNFSLEEALAEASQLGDIKESVEFSLKFLIYRKAFPSSFSKRLPIIGVGALSDMKVKAEYFSLSSDVSPGEHYRVGHLRQLVDERFYRGEFSNLEVGSRIVPVSPSVINKKAVDVSTLESTSVDS